MKSVLPAKSRVKKKRRSAAFFCMDLYGGRGNIAEENRKHCVKREAWKAVVRKTSAVLLRAKRVHAYRGDYGENRDYKQSELYRKLLG